MPDRIHRLWVVEDNPDYLDALRSVLDSSGDMCCERDFESTRALTTYLDDGSTPPDLILCDVHLPGASGVDALPLLRSRMPHVPIVLLTIADSEDLILRAFRAGASGYLVKDATMDQITVALREALRGGTLMPATVAQRVLGFFSSKEQPRYELTGREKEVLFLMSEGYTKGNIAKRLHMSPHTVDSYVRSVYSKLHVNSSAQAVARGVRRGLI